VVTAALDWVVRLTCDLFVVLCGLPPSGFATRSLLLAFFFLLSAFVGELEVCSAAASCYAYLFSNRLPGGGVTFFAAAKKVTKESSFSNQTLPLETASGLTFS
jgi:hypothetical protein